MATHLQPLTVELTRTVKAPADKVFKAWSDPKEMTKWFGCDKMVSVDIKQDFRVGGDYRVDMHLPDGAISTVYGTFTEIVQDKKLAYTWTNSSKEFPARETLVSVEFNQKGSETTINLKHTKFDTQNSVEGHSHGWTFAFEKFAALFE